MVIGLIRSGQCSPRLCKSQTSHLRQYARHTLSSPKLQRQQLPVWSAPLRIPIRNFGPDSSRILQTVTVFDLTPKKPEAIFVEIPTAANNNRKLWRKRVTSQCLVNGLARRFCCQRRSSTLMLLDKICNEFFAVPFKKFMAWLPSCSEKPQSTKGNARQARPCHDTESPMLVECKVRVALG